MDDFKNILILSYFYQYGEDYLLSQLQMILGLTNVQLENRITKLMESKLLKYEENLLTVTTTAIQLVLSKNIESFPFEINHCIQITGLPKISKTALAVDDIYIPRNFRRK